MSKLSSIKSRLLLVCDLTKKINIDGPYKTNSAIAKEVIDSLDLIVEDLTNFMELNYHHKLRYHISRGGGMFPSVPWIAITSMNTKPSKDRSIAICFDKNGLGFVVGVLLPTGKNANYATIYRGNSLKLDVDGRSDFTKYNDRFINPEEFIISEFSVTKFSTHLIKSLDLFDSIYVE